MKIIIAAFLTFLASSLAGAVTLQINGTGKITGATSVQVGDRMVDLEFVDGPCAAVFSGCDDPTDFFFKTDSEALEAGEALSSQVLQNTALGSFDSNSSMTYGCSTASYQCTIYLPYQDGFDDGDTSYVRNYSGGLDFTGLSQFANGLSSFDTSSHDDVVALAWVRFTETTEVPIPGALWLFASGLAAMTGLKRTAH